VTSDSHRNLYDRLMRGASPDAAAKWVSFFAALNERYPPVVFSGPVEEYTREIAINDLRDR